MIWTSIVYCLRFPDLIKFLKNSPHEKIRNLKKGNTPSGDLGFNFLEVSLLPIRFIVINDRSQVYYEGGDG